MGGWREGRVGGRYVVGRWVDGWMPGWVGGQISGWMEGRKGGEGGRYVKGGWMDGWMVGTWLDGWPFNKIFPLKPLPHLLEDFYWCFTPWVRSWN